jgi:site-specific DNA-methyltransferase (adenine-specific)
MEGMKAFPNQYFDLSIVDTPYGIGESGDRNKSRSCKAISRNYKAFHGNDLEAPPLEYFRELFRVSKNQIIWGANHFLSRMPIELINSPCWIVWDKDNGENDFADCELAWSSFPTAVRRFKFRWQGMLQGNMATKEGRIHPCQKPVPLYRWLLEKYASPGYRILDTHAGSASSFLACLELGLDYIGFELDPDYYKAAVQRVEAYRMQPALFPPPMLSIGQHPQLLDEKSIIESI